MPSNGVRRDCRHTADARHRNAYGQCSRPPDPQAESTTIIAATAAHDATVIGNIRVTGHSMPIMVTSMPAPASAFA